MKIIAIIFFYLVACCTLYSMDSDTVINIKNPTTKDRNSLFSDEIVEYLENISGKKLTKSNRKKIKKKIVEEIVENPSVKKDILSSYLDHKHIETIIQNQDEFFLHLVKIYINSTNESIKESDTKIKNQRVSMIATGSLAVISFIVNVLQSLGVFNG